MCELFGYFGISRSITGELKEFFSHSVQHPHGWGLACSVNGHLNVEKEPLRAIDSAYLASRLEAGVKTNIALGHIRLATAGQVSYENSHPFSASDAHGRTWTLVHNGTILVCDALEEFRAQQAGSTDSERVLLYIIAKIDSAAAKAGRELSADERFRIIDSLVSELSANDNKLNILLYDGEQLYAHCNFANSLHVRRDANGVFFSTQALAQGSWLQLPLNTLVAFTAHNLVRFGRKHGNQSFQTAATVAAWQRDNGETIETSSNVA